MAGHSMKWASDDMTKSNLSASRTTREAHELHAPVLQIKDLQVAFGATALGVDRMNLELAQGEILALVGESGSGKSVTGLSVLGLIEHVGGRVTSGSIKFRGKELIRLSDHAWRHIRGQQIALVFQDPRSSLNPVQRVGAQISEQITAHTSVSTKGARSRAVALLDQVGIPNPQTRIDWYPHQFSGGMCQRVAIAMALSCEPELLIADEPTTSLDSTVQVQILRLLQELREQRSLSILLITHDMGVVATLADRVAVAYAGRVVESGTVAEILETPRHPYTAGLIAAVPRVNAGTAAMPIRGEPRSPSADIRGCPFAPRCDYYEAGPCDEEQSSVTGGVSMSVACWRAERRFPSPSGTSALMHHGSSDSKRVI